jgi:hypothetical protein
MIGAHRPMRTLDTRNPVRGWRRDLRLLADLAAMLWVYWTTGARLRRAYRRAQLRGETFWIDEQGPTRHREAPLGR